MEGCLGQEAGRLGRAQKDHSGESIFGTGAYIKEAGVQFGGGAEHRGLSPVQLSITFITNENAVERAELGKDPGYALQPHCTPVLL